MKFLTLAVLALTILSTNAKAYEAPLYVTGTTIFPTYSIGKCVAYWDTLQGQETCSRVASINLPLTSSTLLLLLKEEVREVEADAYNFLAGDEISLALEEKMAKVREVPELANATDEEIISIMLQIANLE